MANEKNGSKNNLLVIIIVAIVALAIGIFGGMQYQKMQTPSFAGLNGAGANGPGGMMRFGGRGFGGANTTNRPVIGQIVSLDNNSLTVKMTDGSTKIVVLSSSTMINKTATASKSDLTTGTNVAVFGTSNSDGSVTAQNVSINPQMMRGVRPSGTQGSTNPNPTSNQGY